MNCLPDEIGKDDRKEVAKLIEEAQLTGRLRLAHSAVRDLPDLADFDLRDVVVAGMFLFRLGRFVLHSVPIFDE